MKSQTASRPRAVPDSGHSGLARNSTSGSLSGSQASLSRRLKASVARSPRFPSASRAVSREQMRPLPLPRVPGGDPVGDQRRRHDLDGRRAGRFAEKVELARPERIKGVFDGSQVGRDEHGASRQRCRRPVLRSRSVSHDAVERDVSRDRVGHVDSLVADLAHVEAVELRLADREQGAVRRRRLGSGSRSRPRQNRGREPSARANVFSRRLVVAREAPAAPPAAQAMRARRPRPGAQASRRGSRR